MYIHYTTICLCNKQFYWNGKAKACRNPDVFGTQKQPQRTSLSWRLIAPTWLWKVIKNSTSHLWIFTSLTSKFPNAKGGGWRQNVCKKKTKIFFLFQRRNGSKFIYTVIKKGKNWKMIPHPSFFFFEETRDTL